MLDLPTGTVSPAGDSRPRPIETDDPDRPRSTTSQTDGGTSPSRDVSRRSKAELKAEIAALRQELTGYETQRQEVIDRYERLLAEYRDRCSDESASNPSPGRLERVRLRVLRTVGLR